jgi:ketosteroid isomerase-like protein
MDRAALSDWIAAYERLWRTPGTDGLPELFGDDAVYSTAPFQRPHRGLKAIEALWENERQSADEEFTMATEIVAVEGDTGVVRVDIAYGEPRDQTYKDLWVITIGDDGRCVSFEEWPFWPSGTAGQTARGAA